MGLTCFYPRMFIGDITDANDYKTLIKCGIRAVVTCGPIVLKWCQFKCSCPLNEKNSDSNNEIFTTNCPRCTSHKDVISKEDTIKHIVLNLEDSLQAAFLPLLYPALEFIQEVLTESASNILIHCWAGQSRSAAVAIGYLMKTTGKSFKLSYDALQIKYPLASPNRWLRSQLYTFGEQEIQLNSQACKTSLEFQKMSESRIEPIDNQSCGSNEEDNMATECLQSVESSPSTPSPLQEEIGQQPQTPDNASSIFSCRLCRTPLFYDNNVLDCDVSNKAKHQLFSGKKFRERPKPKCSSFFIENMSWMHDTSKPTGKLVCCNDKCQAKLGGYSWFGERCSCGAWHTPAFQVHASRVDKLPLSDCHLL